MSAVLLALAAFARAAEPAPAPPAPATAPAATSDAYPLASYAAVGSVFARNSRLAELGWTEAQFNAFIDGVRATFRGKPYAFDDQARALHEEIGHRMEQIAVMEARARREFFADPARLETYMKDAIKGFRLERTDSGLAFGILSKGGGSRPGPDDTVVISYDATAGDAKTELPQLTVKQQRFKVAKLMPGIAEGIQMMTMGSAAMLILPPKLSFSEGVWPAGVDRGTPLIFTVFLHDVISEDAAPAPHG